jgi:hypothetical protein
MLGITIISNINGEFIEEEIKGFPQRRKAIKVLIFEQKDLNSLGNFFMDSSDHKGSIGFITQV